jgi:hypothetical protein
MGFIAVWFHIVAAIATGGEHCAEAIRPGSLPPVLIFLLETLFSLRL